MLTLLKLSISSLRNRRLTVLLSVITIAFSVALLLGVERVRTEARTSFNQTISGTDLIVGAPSGDVQLLLYSVFHLGNASNNISWKSAEQIKARPDVAWTIPLALGDSHKGYRVIGTETGYFKHYQYGQKQSLAFSSGQAFSGLFQAVIGAEVAQKLGYKVGDPMVVAHGMGKTSFKSHDDNPFQVIGILARTGTPVDRSILVSLESLEAIHIGWGQPSVSDLRARLQQRQQSHATFTEEALQPKAITALLVGVKSKTQLFKVQRDLNNQKGEALQAVIPAVALQQVWQLVSVAENALLIVAAFVVVSALVGLMAVILTGLNERRREMAILRAIGARPLQVMSLLVTESSVLTLLGLGFGTLLFYLILLVAAPWLYAEWGIWFEIKTLTPTELNLLLSVAASGILVGLWPGYRAYKTSLADGLAIRL
ncbi:putative ABC transport system permease protein [Oceanospirillum multiglobuliferum]|uniref:Peptide ABC transporter permease n=1 Tax=Oceanospirillum multiglobuliferum TaxID=64969 RepID=A0A1T4RRU9_9GAMM|nr:ABC transporter permease [Oceanospirillum multiglobuliferum]OPX54708.1 peptide ABC transporter permease [Oceanospirillum multiglobuliferum]SKA18719.1 putative ABC transport system permease protein [Oceanospirillum multiglobuliferum]